MDPEIDQLQRRSSGDRGAISLAGGLPAEETFPCEALTRAFARALASEGGAALQYGWPEGRLGLRRWIADWLGRRGAAVEAEDVIVTSGAQQAIAIALESICDPDDAVLVGPLTYPGVLDLLRLRGLTAEPRATRHVRAAYAMPAIGNPLGVPMRAEERDALFALDLPIIEDDAYADLRFDGAAEPPLLARDRRRIWHIGTFSKTICPGLRVGWLVPPPGERSHALGVKHATDLQANTVAQALLEAYLRSGDFEARLEVLRTEYAERAELLAVAIARHLPELRFKRPEGGFAIWAETDAARADDEAELLRAAVEHGTSFDPGGQFLASAPPRDGPLAMRLSFSSAPRAMFDEGARRLAEACREVSGTQRASTSCGLPSASLQRARAGPRSNTMTSNNQGDDARRARASAQPPAPPFPPQHQNRPGLESKIDPPPRYHADRYRPADKLRGKVALITGGDSGIGRAVALIYAREGADVAIVHLPEEAEDAAHTARAIEDIGRRCLSIPGDVTHAGFCRHAVERTVAELGGLDILVNNAAYQSHVDAIEDISDEQWERTFRTNAYGTFAMTKAALVHMKRGSAIINTGSIVGLEGSAALLDYGATKGAIHAFTKSLAQQLVGRGIRVNCVAPGPVWTPLNIADQAPEKVAKFGADTAIGRPAQPEEVAPAFVFFASEADSSYVSGEVLAVLGADTTAG